MTPILATHSKLFPLAVVRDFCADVLRSVGIDKVAASAVSNGLCYASARGIDSHGIFLLPHYVRAVLGGRISRSPATAFTRTASATGMLDAGHGFGHHAGREAMLRAVDIARESGASWVAVANSSHCGALGYFAEIACDHDMVGFAMTHATARVRSHNGISAFFGANPVAFALPMQDEGPLCFDASMTTSTFNAIRLARTLGVDLAPGLAADEEGKETTDPSAAHQLLPIGGHKGFGLAMVVDSLCALLTGMPAGAAVSSMFEDPLSKRRLLGHVVGAIRIDAFVDPATFKARLQEQVRQVRAQEPADPRVPVMIPGDPEKKTMADRLANGLHVSAPLAKELERVAKRCRVPGLPSRIGAAS